MNTLESHPEFNGNEPATIDSISACEKSLNYKLPKDYVEFLMIKNGGEGFIGNESYLILWPIEDIVNFNREYEVANYCPGLLLIGSSGGGEAYAFDMRNSPWSVVQVPFVGMDYSLVELIGLSFQGFIDTLAKKAANT